MGSACLGLPRDAVRGRPAAGCHACAGQGRSEWAALSAEDLRILDEGRVTNTYQPGQVVFYQANPCLGVYCIQSGQVALRKSDEQGRSAIVRLAHAGQMLGHRSFFAGGGYSATAQALTESVICFLGGAAVRKVMEANPAVSRLFLKQMAEELERAESARLQTSLLPVRARVASALVMLRDSCGTVEDDGVLVIELPLSRQDLASMVGARPETIARTIRAFGEEGVATFAGRTVRVPDLDALFDEMEAAVT